MKEKTIEQIEWLISDVRTAPDECFEWQIDKIEGALDFANSLNLITQDEYITFYKKLLNIKCDRI